MATFSDVAIYKDRTYLEAEDDIFRELREELYKAANKQLWMQEIRNK